MSNDNTPQRPWSPGPWTQDGDNVMAPPAPRRIEMQLIAFGQERESQMCTPREASLLLAEPMAKGHRWQIAPPYTAEPDQDAEEERYRLDCEAVGIDPSDVLDPRGA